MQQNKQIGSGIGSYSAFKDVEVQNQIQSLSYKQQWIAKATRVPPRKVHTTDISRIKNRLFAFNQRNCALSIGTMVGSCRHICSWAKLLGLTVSSFLFIWTLCSFSIIKYLKGDQNIEYFYTNLLCLVISLISLSMLSTSLIIPRITTINLNSMETSLLASSGVATRNLISYKTLSTIYLIVSLLSIFPASMLQMDSYNFTTTILSAILAAHLAPSFLFYIAHLRREDGYNDDRNIHTPL
ncbi:uncharacterized protein cubi_02923 [Cryptosporidium ubiquitum]|uniref:Uncharacterized protein n=1 Tax=Cryptosporidium ubiquitum TaxID=857276 RepID=A0A1J4MIQ9_9CRYT|nr:uncharacterized protein cubi_02923 [Cryptosporidium ubiquitum]OII74121.1 hypothetical protein cubi_02923 [Cryptosporidium ubiquitum]